MLQFIIKGIVELIWAISDIIIISQKKKNARTESVRRRFVLKFFLKFLWLIYCICLLY